MSRQRNMNDLSSTRMVPTVRPGVRLIDLLPSWERSLRAGNVSPRTLRSYLPSVRLFCEYLAAHSLPDTTTTVTREACEHYLTDCLRRCTPGTVRTYLRCLQLYFHWLTDEQEMASNPLARVRTPMVPDDPTPVLSIEQLRALIHACEGRDFQARRDMAIFRLEIDTGLRRAELTGLHIADVDLTANVAHVRATTAKGRHGRICPFGVQASAALDRYLRVRLAHPHANSPELWLGLQGPLHYTAIPQILKHRAQQAGITQRVWLHQLRHTATHLQLERGDQEGNIMHRFGWRNRDMLARYGAGLAAERSIEAYHQKPSPGDLL